MAMNDLERKVLLLEHQHGTLAKTLEEIRQDIKQLLEESQERREIQANTTRRLDEIEPTVKSTANAMLFVRMSRWLMLLFIGVLTVTTDLWMTIAKLVRLTKG
jgi:regulator of replication initiation timing